MRNSAENGVKGRPICTRRRFSFSSLVADLSFIPMPCPRAEGGVVGTAPSAASVTTVTGTRSLRSRQVHCGARAGRSVVVNDDEKGHGQKRKAWKGCERDSHNPHILLKGGGCVHRVGAEVTLFFLSRLNFQENTFQVSEDLCRSAIMSEMKSVVVINKKIRGGKLHPSSACCCDVVG